MTRPEKGVFEYRPTITNDDIDILNHVNNLVYLRWSQEAAIEHWNSVANEDIQKEIAWVIVRNEIDYLRPAFLDNKIIVYTWVGKSEDTRSIRYVQICNGETGKVFANVKTTWCLVDATTLRSRVIDNKVLEVLSRF